MQRRTFIQRSALTAASALVASAAATRAFGAGHANHPTPSAGGKARPSLQKKATDCVSKGETCLQHCLDMLAMGDVNMAECARTVRELLVYCGALAKAAAQNSKHLKEIAAISLSVCKECETACLKHKDMAVCRECADACVACAEECKAQLA